MNNPIRIFLIDDNPFFLEAIQEFLGMEKAFVVAGSATNGQSALAQIAELHPDLVLLDLNLGDQSGLELVPRIKTLLADKKIIVLTIMQEQTYQEAAKQAGASGFITENVAFHPHA
ncbi:MAG TPA: response regulator transcription factor [Caldithrix sp.]|nr:response regulator transcription factor [Caldithrix sp.]